MYTKLSYFESILQGELSQCQRRNKEREQKKAKRKNNEGISNNNNNDKSPTDASELRVEYV